MIARNAADQSLHTSDRSLFIPSAPHPTLENFERLAVNIDVEPITEALHLQRDLYKEITARQQTPGSPHSDTETIFIRWAKSLTIEAAFTEIEAVDYPALKRLPEIRPLIDEVLKVTKAEELGRVLVVSLKPGGFIVPHADEGAYADHYERFHLSIQSKLGNRFFSETFQECGEFVHMKPGEIWWFNHKRPHWVINQSDAPRIHLIVDAVAPRFRRERI